MWLAICRRKDPSLNTVEVIASLANPTGALPTARHKERGALGVGDDPLSASLFLLMVLDNLQIEKDRLIIGSGIHNATNLPTPFGRIDIHNGTASGRWVDRPRPIIFR